MALCEFSVASLVIMCQTLRSSSIALAKKEKEVRTQPGNHPWLVARVTRRNAWIGLYMHSVCGGVGTPIQTPVPSIRLLQRASVHNVVDCLLRQTLGCVCVQDHQTVVVRPHCPRAKTGAADTRREIICLQDATLAASSQAARCPAGVCLLCKLCRPMLAGREGHNQPPV